MIYRFGRFELDEDAGELRAAGTPVAIQPKPLALLLLLVKERHRVLSQDELMEALWPGTSVTSGSLTRAVSHARRAIGDTHKGDLLRSLPRRGYRFAGDVLEIGGGPDSPPPDAGTPPARPPSRVHAGELFVGRDDAMATLERARLLSERGPGRIVLITGRAGVGKTRLVEVFARAATEQGALVAFGRGRDGEGVPAFWIWSELLRALSSAGLAREDELEAILSGLRETTDAEQRFRFFDAVARALVAASHERPLVLVLEDLQWANPASLRLLDHLAFELPRARILLVATVRDEARRSEASLDATLALLHRHEAFDHVALAGLSRAEIGSLLSKLIGRPTPTELTSELFARTEGVPLFVREAIRLLEERGELRHPERISRRGISLPTHAVDLIRRMLSGLSRETADLVAAGAVLGRDFTVAHVAAVADVARDVVLDRLEEAVAAGVLEEAADAAATFRFTHALFKEAAYEALAAGARARYHARAAARLEQQYADDPTPAIAELAHHHHESIAVGDPERAFGYALLAGREAERLVAYEQAAVHYEQALDALEHFDTMPTGRRLGVLIALGEAHRRSGDRERRREVSGEAMKTARALGQTDDFARAAIRFCDINEWTPDDAVAAAVVDEALELLDESAAVLRARLITRRAYLRLRDSNALPIAREAVERARAAGDPLAIQEAIYILLYALAGPDHLEERRALRGPLIEAALRLKSPDSAVIGLLDIASDFLALGDPKSARAQRQQVTELIGDSPSLGATWHTKVFDTGIALLEGRLDEVEQTMSDALLVGRRIAHPYAQICYNGHLMQLHRFRGEHDAVASLYAPLVRGSGSSAASHWPQAVYARSAIRTGDRERALGIWEGLARTDFANVTRSIRWIGTMVELAHLCADLEDARRAEALIAQLAPVEHLHAVIPMAIQYGGPATHALARLHELMGDADTAIQYYASALQAAIDLGARPAEARIRLDMAGPVGRRGDRAQAAELEASGKALAERIGCIV
jgi:DNA-binding winged helix-turn-helix (wHTH) protein